jgi:hypothetical protein
MIGFSLERCHGFYKCDGERIALHTLIRMTIVGFFISFFSFPLELNLYNNESQNLRYLKIRLMC